MRKRTLGVALLAGLAISGGSAFTAANDVTAVEGGNTNVAGYGAATVTGATVKNVDYTHDTANGALVDEIKFVTAGDLTAKDARVTLWNGLTNNGSYTCTGTIVTTGQLLDGVSLTAGDTLFTCSTPDEPIADFNDLGITVNN